MNLKVISKERETNWMYVAVVLVSAAITGAWLISYINSDPVQGAVDVGYVR
ncbi:MAG: hypothetical protein L7H18_01355 [Candidatus Nealsonbacteria bacterium DGGOD1a]|jgi:hypothetical protein|nr:MAG: hypothetical protein L7H18_01355 [Candidatus Nealsonbacteria bacterium DGGOD1a]